jgi:DNA-binding transcriptional regulator YiaG
MNDMVKRKRSSANTKNPRAKLDEQAVKEIRFLREKRGMTLKGIAGLYGVHLATIGYICQGKTWK